MEESSYTPEECYSVQACLFESTLSGAGRPIEALGEEVEMSRVS